MAQCPNCHSEVKAEERFCGNCGARIEPSIPPPASPPAVNEPPRTTGKETIVLPKITDLGLQPPTPPQPPADATIIATPAPQPTPPAQPPVAPTMMGNAPSVPPSGPPYGGADPGGTALPPG